MAAGDAREGRKAGYANGYHGGQDVARALHLDDSAASFSGKRILFVGDLACQWDFVAQLQRKGATVHSEHIGVVANPSTRSLISSQLRTQKKYDQVLFYMVLAFFSRNKELSRVLTDSLRAIDWKRDGEFILVSFDFGVTGKEENLSDVVTRLQELMFRFFRAAKLDPFQGRYIRGEVETVARKQREHLHVAESIHRRPNGSGYWEELRDLCDMLIEQSREALAGIGKVSIPMRVIFLRDTAAELRAVVNGLEAHIAKVDGMLKLPEAERPDCGTPPALHTVIVRRVP